ncbi:MAG: homoserine kinase [Actinomycetota bacterium]
MRFTVRVPATSANLGPGFDCFGLALDLCNEVTFDTHAEPAITWEGEGADELPIDGSDLILETMRRVAAGRALPAFRLHGLNRVPLARGFGSSSAAVVAGVVAALTLLGSEPTPTAVFPLAAAIEGHPDNAAPACCGGFTIALPGGSVHRFDPHPDVRPVLLVPDLRGSTVEARAALPDLVPRADAVFNAAHAALMLRALTDDPGLLGDALRDRIHQDVRLALVPPVAEVFRALRDDGVPVCVSGAGPALLAFEGGDAVADPGDGWRVLRPGVRRGGFESDSGS